MPSKILFFVSLLLTAIAGCAPEPTATPTLPPAPTATLERAPTRAPTGALAAPTPSAASGAVQATAAATRPAGSSAVSGKFVFAPGDGSLWIQDSPNALPRPLVKPSSGLFADAPAFSPDGSRVVYTESSLTPQGVAQVSIHLVNADGSGGRLLAAPPDIKTAFNWPAFSPDGRWIYYTASFPVPPNKEDSEIQRIPSQGGAAQSILHDARSAVLSSDGQDLAFLRFNFDTFSAALWLAAADGQNPKRLIADDLFAGIAGESFSPDGQWILFAASGPPTRKLPGIYTPARPDLPSRALVRARPTRLGRWTAVGPVAG